MLDLLVQREWPVDQLALEMDLPVANTPQHLQVLSRARLVDTRRQGTRVYYRLAGEDVLRLWETVRDVGEARLAEVPAAVRRHLGDRPEMLVVNVADLLRRVKTGEVILLGHNHALQLPLERFVAYQTGELPPVPAVFRAIKQRNLE